MPTALERLVWGFGDGSTIPVFETPIGKIGSVICWENSTSFTYLNNFQVIGCFLSVFALLKFISCC